MLCDSTHVEKKTVSMLESQPAIYSETLCALCYLGGTKNKKKPLIMFEP